MAAPATHVPNVGLEYYVDIVNGSDSNNGTSTGLAWATLKKARDFVKTSATWPSNQDVRVNVLNGTYQDTGAATTLPIETFTTAGKIPNANQWLLWHAYPGHSPVIAPGTVPNGSGDCYGVTNNQLGDGGCSFNQFKGLKIDGLGNRYGTHNCVGAYISNTAANVQWVECEITRVQVSGSGPATTIAQGLFIDPGCSNNIVTRCRIHDNGTNSGDTINGQEHAIYCGGDNNSFYNNLIYNQTNGFGIQIYNSGAAINGTYICFNTIAGTIKKSCMIIPGNSTGAIIRNNIFRNATEFGHDFIPATFTGSGNFLENNFYYSNTAGTIARNGTPNTAQPAGWTFTSNDLNVTDPGNVSYASKDFHLLSTAAARGYATTAEGVTVDIDSNARDTAPDAGAYEFQTPTPPFVIERHMAFSSR